MTTEQLGLEIVILDLLKGGNLIFSGIDVSKTVYIHIIRVT